MNDGFTYRQESERQKILDVVVISMFPILRELRQEDQEFKIRLDYRVTGHLK